MSTKTDELFETITKKVIEIIESGETGKWDKPWTSILGGTGLHQNASTKKDYQGFNQLALMVEAFLNGYEMPVWATYKQFQALGGQVRKGEKGTPLVKWGVTYFCDACKHKGAFVCKVHGNQAASKKVWASSFTVFNVAQQDGFEVARPAETLTEPERFENVERFIAATGATIKFVAGDRAYHRRDTDEITLPLREQFKTAQGFYGTALHELTHWSAGPDRLERVKGTVFGDENYAKEELVAELGATFLAAKFGVEVDPSEEHAVYIAGWLRAIKDDPKALYRAARDAQKATEFLLALTEGEETVEVAA